MEEIRETLSEFENFIGNKENFTREKINTINGCPTEQIETVELEEFGHTYQRPQGILKMNILRD